MSQKFYLQTNEKVLTRESWLWFSINKNKPLESPHEVLIELEEVDPLSGDITQMGKQIIQWMRNYRGLYDSLELETVSFHRGCGDYDHKTFLVGRRLETEEEVQARVNEVQKEQAELEAIESKKQQDKEKKERELLTKLQNKYKE